MSRSQVYTLHFWPKLAHAEHYTGTTCRPVPARLTDHALGRGARITQVQVQRGGSWVIGNIQPGGRNRERALKGAHQGSRHCDVCQAIKGYQAGRLSQEQALACAGWDRATEYERGLLLDIFGIEKPPPPAPTPTVPAPRAPEPQVLHEISPEVAALADALIAGWTRQAAAESGAEPELEAGS
jgi:hypothetical protein